MISGIRRFSGIIRGFAAKVGLESFVWSKAQEHEIGSSERWIKENFESLFARIETVKASGEHWPGSLDLLIHEFFNGQKEEWSEFAAYISDKTCLEVGAGPCGALVGWWWVRRRIVIDPLVTEYRRITLELFERTWYTDEIELLALPGERLVGELVGMIDGAVICRNTLDHCENPMSVLENIAAYCRPGCYLLLWTDLWHPGGHGEGHRNITKQKDTFQRSINDLGFEILYSFEDVDRPTINYGCRARKRIQP